MFKRRDIPPVLLLLLLIILVMLTLSQILVVHNGRYGRNIHSMRKLQLELRQMDINLHTMMMQNVPSIELNRRLLQNSINSRKVAHIIAEAARPDRHFVPTRMRRNRTRGRTKQASILRRGSLQPSTERLNATGSFSSSSSSSSSAQELIYTKKQNYTTHINVSTKGSIRSSEELSADYFREGRRTARLAHKTDIANNRTIRLTAASSGNFSVKQTILSTSSRPARKVKGLRTPEVPARTSGNSIIPVGGKTDDEILLSTKSAAHELQDNGVTIEFSTASQLQISSLSSSSSSSLSSSSSSSSSSSQQRGHDTSNRPYCPPVPPDIKGRIFINFSHKHDYTESEVMEQNPDLLPGGAWRPIDCIARHKVAIIIPYRDRKEHLTILLSHLHPMLRRQQLDYRIYVVEQYGEYTFNKARIMNIAFVEALKQYSFQCFVFHDVDLVPEDDRNMYSCPILPRHMSVAIDEMGYKLAYQELVGGVLNMRTEHFQSVNGYSNLYWGWGAEDDDMAYRIMYVGLKITRPPESVARYKMIRHTKRKPSDWRKRAKLLYTGTRRFQFDGLNSLQYKLLSIENRPLSTHILVDIGKPPKGF